MVIERNTTRDNAAVRHTDTVTRNLGAISVLVADSTVGCTGMVDTNNDATNASIATNDSVEDSPFGNVDNLCTN